MLFLKRNNMQSFSILKVSIIILLLSALLFPDANAGTTDWKKEADIMVRQEQLDKAEKFVKDELKKDKEHPVPFWMELGQINVEKENWGKAKDYFNKVVKAEPENLLARYYLGICYREIGKFQAFFLRKNQWQKARDCFEKIIAADSTFRDVWYQYALLERLNKKYTRAIKKAVRQINIKPNLEDAYVGLVFVYQSFILHTEYEKAEQWLKSDSTDYSTYFLGELYRQHKKFHAADSIFNRLKMYSTQVRRPLINLSLVRSKVAQGKGLEAESLYWQTVDGIRDSLDARLLFEDLKYVCKDEEIERFHAIRTVPGWKDFFRKFWVKRDPLPAMADNLRLIEHYRRMVYAEDNYRYDGFRSWNANPDQQEYLKFPKAFYLNQEFNDKGLVYIRHGDPDEKSTALGEQVTYNESWLYKRRDGFDKMIFHFEIDEDGLAGDWRLTPMLRDTEAVESVEMWDPAYARYLRGDQFIRARVANEIAQVSRHNVQVAMSTDRHSWREKVEYLPVHFTISNFKKSSMRDLCQVDLSFPVADLLKKNGNREQEPVSVGVAIHDKNWNEIARESRTINLLKSDSLIVDGEYIESFKFSLVPRTYYLAFHVDPLNSPELGGSKMMVTLPYFGSDRLICSDILLAHSIQPIDPSARVSRSNVRIMPNPTRKFSLNSPVFFYLEIYNLQLNKQGQSDYLVTVTVKDLKQKRKGGFLGLFGKKDSAVLSLTSERQGTSKNEVEWVSLDVSHLQPGEKKLTVHVQDRISKSEDIAETTFYIEE